MKSKGFTLAEVLITITILGVIALLAVPALLTNIQKAKAGPALMRAISILDNANSLMFVEREIYNFSETCYGENGEGYVAQCFVPFVQEQIGASQDAQEISYMPFTGEGDPLVLSNGFTAKNGFTYYFDTENEDEAGIIAMIDINGISGPNTIGKDLFYTYISYAQNGKVIPHGSRVDESSAGAWEGNCDADGVNDAQFCAGSISDNSGKIIYPW